jgi:hypothetical protein
MGCIGKIQHPSCDNIGKNTCPESNLQKALENQNDWAQWLMSIILATWEAEIGKTAIQGYPRQKVPETLYQQKKLGMVVWACHPSYCGKNLQEDLSLGWPRQK